MNLRYVLYSEELGIYLGPTADHEDGTAWSKRNPDFYSSAITFEKLSQEQIENLCELSVPVRQVEVWPDLPNDRASIDACANAQLPRWQPDSK